MKETLKIENISREGFMQASKMRAVSTKHFVETWIMTLRQFSILGAQDSNFSLGNLETSVFPYEHKLPWMQKKHFF